MCGTKRRRERGAARSHVVVRSHLWTRCCAEELTLFCFLFLFDVTDGPGVCRHVCVCLRVRVCVFVCAHVCLRLLLCADDEDGAAAGAVLWTVYKHCTAIGGARLLSHHGRSLNQRGIWRGVTERESVCVCVLVAVGKEGMTLQLDATQHNTTQHNSTQLNTTHNNAHAPNPMAGNASVVLVHPSSTFFGHDGEKLKWVIFHQVLWTNKVGGRKALWGRVRLCLLASA